MEKVAVILGGDNPLGASLCRNLLEQEWKVIAGVTPGDPSADDSVEDSNKLISAYPNHYRTVSMDPSSIQSLLTAASVVAEEADSIDLLISSIDRLEADSFMEGLDFESVLNSFDTNALGPIRFIEAFLPLTEKGSKRIGIVSSLSGSIETASHADSFGYSMSRTALHMAIQNMANLLGKEGYSFRVYLQAGRSLLEHSASLENIDAVCRFFKDRGNGDSSFAVVDSTGKQRTLSS
ncbi:SDR family NAD(P)-dependent oxidoreductase [Paenibacillus sp. UNC451MF]|uniref:SDR family NAD(P)-dependent oxidoreductase n=1 Tax=Paenibacillus sp. UNC451MF TaxID=1449063 RepID=UPI00055B1E1A|nr:SDR family NAD(P)-dependent oxidoreductase [Paenibacillus sp. UNC451MF]